MLRERLNERAPSYKYNVLVSPSVLRGLKGVSLRNCVKSSVFNLLRFHGHSRVARGKRRKDSTVRTFFDYFSVFVDANEVDNTRAINGQSLAKRRRHRLAVWSLISRKVCVWIVSRNAREVSRVRRRMSDPHAYDNLRALFRSGSTFNMNLYYLFLWILQPPASTFAVFNDSASNSEWELELESFVCY